MKHVLTTLCLVLTTSLRAAEQAPPDFQAFPSPGSDWSIADDRQPGNGQFSWRHFKHRESGGVIAIVAWYTPGLGIDSSPVRQASIETITSSGYAYAKTRILGKAIDDTVRHQKVSIVVRNSAAGQKKVYHAIEYTYVYEGADKETPSTMAHGYVVQVGDFTVFVQHTANRVISSDTAKTLVMDLAFEDARSKTSILKGWGASISR